MRSPGSVIRPRFIESLCGQCSSQRLTQQAAGRRPFSQTSLPRASAVAFSPSARVKTSYFLSNSVLDRFNGSDASQLAPDSVAPTTRDGRGGQQPGPGHADGPLPPASAPAARAHPNAHLPHRRRQAARRDAASEPTRASAAAADTVASPSPETAHLPAADASAMLAHLASRQPENSLRRTLSALLSLSKPRLTVLVVLSAMAPYALYPVPAFLSPTALADAAPSLSPLTLLFLTAGTTLCSSAANALNMLYEPDTDSLMSRTRSRPLPRGLLRPRAALLFAVACAAAGTAALWAGVNPTVAGLGVANIVLYAGVYTPLKRVSTLNTWVGAVVGAIPPLMGWAAAAGESATGDGGWRELLFHFPGAAPPSATAAPPSSAGGWLLAGLLFAWQFAHFMALSWPVRHEYRAAGLRMLAWVDPARNARVALRYALAFVPLCFGLCAVGVTEWSFAVTSLPVNAWLVREAVTFWRLEGHKGSARGLFWASVWHLPVVMVLALVQKKGMWGRVWRSVVGEPDDDEEWDEWEEEEEEEEGGKGGG